MLRSLTQARWAELDKELSDLKQKNLLRSLTSVSEIKSSRVDFSSNDYLGLSRHPRVIKKAAEALRVWGAGSGASRLFSGNLRIHEDLERKIAAFKKEKAATVFSSGYLANLGVITALLNEKDLIVVDRLNHASLVDAARLSKAKLWVYPHRNVQKLKELLARAKGFRRRLVVTDAYFSMDGDVAPLDRLYEACRAADTLFMVDEAHSTGVFGKTGRGLTEHFGLSGKSLIVMGTLSKALGSVGGFVAGDKILRDYLINRSREFIYTTAPSPAASAAAMESLSVLEKDASPRKRLWENALFLRKSLQADGFDLMGSEGPVIPIRVGDTAKTMQIKESLKKKNFWVAAVRPPTVPQGTDRIRLSVTASHTKPEMELFLKEFQKAVAR